VPVHSPVCLGIRRRCRNAAHTATVVGAGGMRAGAGVDGGGMVAQAGAGIDSGGDDILVELDLGGQRTGLGAVVGTSRCGGRGSGRRCLRRRHGARGSSRSIQDETR
jgi:hypothetical protein